MELLELKAVHYTGEADEGGVLGLEESVHLTDGLFVNARTQDYAQEVSLHLPREEVVKLVEAGQVFLEETKPELPTLPHATIKAKLAPDGTQRVLTLVEPGDARPWVANDGVLSADWFGDEDIVSFEVLFPGVEA